MTDKRLRFVDALRGIAILLVIAAHACLAAELGGLQGNLLAVGGYGVQLFFVISAFTIFLTFERAVLKESNPIRNFFIRRLFRIVPIYWMGIILYTLIYGLGSRGWTPAPRLWHFPVHFLLLNSLFPTTQSSVVPGGWSISCEVAFYLTVPLWYFLLRNLRTAALFTIFTVVGGCLAIHVLRGLLQAPLYALSTDVVNAFWYRNILNQLGCFSFGILLYFITRAPRGEPVKAGVLVLLFLVALALAFVIPVNLHSSHYFWAAGFMWLALVLSRHPHVLIVNRFTVFMGRISYSAYLFHFLVLKGASHLLSLPLGSRSLYFCALYLVGLAGTIPLAYLSFKYVETPLISLGHGWVNRLEARTAKMQTSEIVK